MQAPIVVGYTSGARRRQDRARSEAANVSSEMSELDSFRNELAFETSRTASGRDWTGDHRPHGRDSDRLLLPNTHGHLTRADGGAGRLKVRKARGVDRRLRHGAGDAIAGHLQPPLLGLDVALVVPASAVQGE